MRFVEFKTTGQRQVYINIRTIHAVYGVGENITRVYDGSGDDEFWEIGENIKSVMEKITGDSGFGDVEDSYQEKEEEKSEQENSEEELWDGRDINLI